MSRKYRVQVVANTHSYECLEAMLDGCPRDFGTEGVREICASSPEVFLSELDLSEVRLHRLEVREGKNLAVTFGPEELQTALKKQLEVR